MLNNKNECEKWKDKEVEKRNWKMSRKNLQFGALRSESDCMLFESFFINFLKLKLFLGNNYDFLF